MQDDFFNDGEPEFDASTEALEARFEAVDEAAEAAADAAASGQGTPDPEPGEQPAVEQPAEPADDDMVEIELEDGEELPEGAVVVEQGGDEEKPAEEQPEPDPEDSSELPEKYQGKSPEEIVRLANEERTYFNERLKALEDERKREQAEANAQFEQLTQLMAQQAQMQQQAHLQSSTQHVGQQLVDHTFVDPWGAFNQARALVGQGRVSEQVLDDVIDTVYANIDPTQASQMRAQVMRDQVQAQTQQMVEQQVTPLRRQAFEANSEAAVREVMASEPDDFAEFREELAERVKELEPRLEEAGASRQQIAQALTYELNLLRGQHPERTAKYKAATVAAKKDQQVQAPAAPAAQRREVPKTPEQDYWESIQRANQSGADELMAGFGA